MFREPLKLQLRILQITMALFALVLLSLTWKLWTPQTLFPQVPLFSRVSELPPAVDWLSFAIMVLTLISLFVLSVASLLKKKPEDESAPRFQMLCGCLFLLSFLLEVVFDQHRLQPWAYQFALGLLILTVLKPPRAIPLFRLFVLSIYFYSALSKCDASFVQTLGRQLAEGLFSAVGISTTYWSPQTLSWIAASFPIGEFLIAFGLFFRRTRQVALWAAVGMHLTLMLAIGPLGLNHYKGVLIWNVYFIFQDLILFHTWFQNQTSVEPVGRQAEEQLSPPTYSGLERAVQTLIWIALLAPLLEPTGYFDHWPSWGLYASHHDRVVLLIDEEAKWDLPPDLQPFVDSPRPLSRWCRVRVERWSLADLGAPLYPQARFQLGVAIAVGKAVEQDSPGDASQPRIRLLYESAADRWSGERKIREYNGLSQIEALSQEFLLNATPRPFPMK
ncbi:hypothetical protein [Gimesia maris]|uniref:Vitamin K-dependent gamma-carboxylase n=1 Tax=Gimesia maris TaxID=122 RepID=A0ABX5YX37_9PLAN|nr:hypothetical protein [Gimesia maris]EDL60935.1 hypothetical protein PM8797T_09454 [Gimesia maris DSM 8797]QEG20131.1 hypothetical protein GmarT_60400 [Gimesia maris]QGQ32399.1 hypothetical protein F1729_29220 [Gimesia maris]